MTDDFQSGPEGPDAPDTAPPGDPFAHQRQRAADRGGFIRDLPNHVLSYLPNGGRSLVVAFDNLAATREVQDRTAWGQKFLLENGHDVLGVQIKRRDWYRDADLIRALVALRDEGFFRRFPRVATFGASMGGFAALAFAPLSPGCTSVAFAPQRSLSLHTCPWEKRYRFARQTYWDEALSFNDAAEGLRSAARAYIAFDPRLAEDRKHASALSGPQVRFLPMPHMGHKLPPALLKMGILKPLALAALDGTLDAPAFARLMRARRDSTPWRADLLQRALDRGHLKLGHRAAQKEMADRPHWKIRHLLTAYETARHSEESRQA